MININLPFRQLVFWILTNKNATERGHRMCSPVGLYICTFNSSMRSFSRSISCKNREQPLSYPGDLMAQDTTEEVCVLSRNVSS